MLTRVATSALNDRLLSQTLALQARTANLQLQQASGQVSEDYAGLGSDTKTVLDLETTLARANARSDAASEAASRMDVMDSVLSGITDLLESFRSSLTSAQGTDTSDTALASLQDTAKQALSELADLLNTNFEGRYLFSGSRTTTEPIDLSSYSAGIDDEDTSYYAGDDDIIAVQLSNSQSSAYGITANNTAFEKAFRALSSIANDADLPDSDDISAAYDLVLDATDAVTAIQTVLGTQAATVDRFVSNQTDYIDQLTSLISGLKDVDITAVAVKLSAYETQLQASYAAIANLGSLSIVSYLK